MGDRSEKTNIRDKPRKCPFRVTTKMEYVCFEGCDPVTTKVSYEYPPCYEEGCPFWAYVAGEGYKCTQVEGGIEDVQEGYGE